MPASITTNLFIEYLPPEQIKLPQKALRAHSAEQIEQIARSILEFDFPVPILIDQENFVISGAARLLAAIQLGRKQVPCIRITHLSRAQVKAFQIADNRLAEKAKWDKVVLGEFFLELSNSEISFSLDITGFSHAEIDLAIQGLGDFDNPQADPADEQERITAKAVSVVGDLWQAGRHFIYCGNALEDDSYSRLMGSTQASAVFIDPPYNVPIDGHASGNGKVRHHEFPMASGEMDEADFTAFLSRALCQVKAKLIDGGLLYVCMDWRHQYELLTAIKNNELLQKNLAVWVKNNAGMGSFYRSQHELVFILKHGLARHQNNVELGKFGRSRSNVWNYPAINAGGRKSEEGDLLAMHPTVKPVALIADALMDCTARGDVVLDCFLGSGSTLIAAERIGRVCYGIELDPLYVDTAIRRWQRLTRQLAIHVETQTTFEDRSKASNAA